MPDPSHRTVRTDLVYGSCIPLFYQRLFLKAERASHPVFTSSIEYNPSATNHLFGIAKLDKGLFALRHEFIWMNVSDHSGARTPHASQI